MPKISHSTATAFEDCEKKWAFQELDGLEQLPSVDLEIGKLVHSQVEAGLKKQEKTADYIPRVEGDQVFKDNFQIVDPRSLAHVNYAVDFVEMYDPKEVQVESWLESWEGDLKINGKLDCLSIQGSGTRFLIDWKTKKKQPMEFDFKVYRQLHLYGNLVGLKEGDQVVAGYPQWQTEFTAPFNPEDGIKARQWIIGVAERIAEFKENYYSASEITGRPHFLCNYCPFREKCPDRWRNGAKR